MKVHQNLQIDCRWNVEKHSLEATKPDIADIGVKLDDVVLTQILDRATQKVRDFFRASPTRVAFWFADNWWRLRSETIPDPRYPSVEWRLRHEMSSASGGVLWPPIMIYSVGERIVFAPSLGGRHIGGPSQYLGFSVTSVSASAFERGIDAFFAEVLAEGSRLKDGPSLATLIKQLNTERADTELAGWRKLEACLGYDPDAAPDRVVEALTAYEDRVGKEGVEEAALATPGEQAPENLGNVLGAAEASNLSLDFTLSGKIQIDRTALVEAQPWQYAEAAAHQLRDIIQRPTEALRGKVFGEIFQTRWEDLKAATATARNLPFAATLVHRGEVRKLALQTQIPRDRRFEIARMFADAVWDRSHSFGPVTRARTDRQRFQRAFAQSLLCPYEGLRNIVDVNAPTAESITAAAKYFHVHPNVVRSLLVYKGIIPYQNLEEQLELA